ncbi:MAG: GNAT family N-acetyltransferase [Pseudomonadota bacterium]
MIEDESGSSQVAAAQLAQVRRLEANSFRSFPASTTIYDGTWVIRLTEDYPAKRLNSVNPLDPSDTRAIESRLVSACDHFHAIGRPGVFRLSPLSPQGLADLLVAKNWQRFDESIVMAVDLDLIDLSSELDRLPLQDLGSWVSSFLYLSNDDQNLAAKLVEVIGNIEAVSGLFVIGEDEIPTSALRCVHDRDLVGIFDVVVDKEYRAKGYGKSILTGALKWAKANGASRAWLQVTADNQSAIKLYERFGFKEVYRYAYYQEPDDQPFLPLKFG